MLQYNSNASFPTPAHQQAVQGMATQPSPYAGQNHQDIFRGLQQRGAVDLSRYAQQKQDEYESAASNAQRELALSGLTMMGRARDNAQDMQGSRLQMLLRGLL
jgi:hypothetical protein